MRRLVKYAFVSDRLKGNTSNRRVIRRCQPPLPFTILLMIHDAAEPHTKTFSRLFLTPTVFQKYSKASRNPERRASSHGASSKKSVIGFPSAGIAAREFARCWNASSHVAGILNAMP